jgi:multiple sugar transport system ATP-binding protein
VEKVRAIALLSGGLDSTLSAKIVMKEGIEVIEVGSMVSVKLENVTKKFGNIIAVNKLNLDIKDGEFVCLLGPSGCGKTTTLRCIAGLDNFTEGNIYFNGEVINHLPPQQRNIGMVFQFYVVYRMSVRENLAFPLEIKKLPRTEIEYKVKEIAEILKIDHLLDVKATKLGPADKQRVALGRALVKEPRVLLLDEPLTNLDAKLRAEMRSELKRLQSELGQTTIYATPDCVEAMSVADRIAVLNKGKLQQYDTPENVYNRPSNIFVADFVGIPSMNFIEGDLLFNGTKIFFDSGEFRYELTWAYDIISKHKTDGKVIMGIRPRDVKIVKTGDVGFEMEVYGMEQLGLENILYLKSGNIIIKKTVSSESTFQMGEKLRITFDKKR